ncbi:MAG: type II toxin-antitoxin system RelE/ParE family toxin [Bacteroidota bacterium]
MARVTWSSKALDELDAICDFIAETSPRRGRKLWEDLFGATERLGLFPQSGRVVPEIGDEALREVVHRGYRLLYYVTGDELKVLTVFHSAKPFGP